MPRARWLVLGVLGVLVIYGALSSLRLLQAAHHLERGETAITTVRAELTTADLTESKATPELHVAEAEFAEAHNEIHSSWLDPLHVVPYVGRQVDSLNALSGAAATVTQLGSTALSRVQSLLSAPHHTPAERAVVVRNLASVIDGLNSRVERISLGPSKALLPIIATKRNTFVTDLNKLRAGLNKGQAAADAIATLLDNDQRYLIFTANNAEMRDGSGMFLQAGTVTTDDGRLTLGGFHSTAELASPTPLTPISGDLAARWGALSPNADYRNLGLSPQFELNAPVAAAMWKAQTGQKVDGVLTVDVAALQDLLAVTGPVSAGGVTIDAADVQHYLFVTQYVGVTGNAATNETRRQELGLLAEGVFRAIQGGGVSLTHLASALDQAVDGRHILAWSADPTTEADWVTAGASGQLGPDDVLLGTINKGVNKLDPYQQVTARLRLSPHGKDTEVQISATVHNDTPPGLPPYTVGGATPASPVDYYTGALALDLPKSAGDVTERGGTGVVAIGADGPSNVLAVGVQVAPGATKTVTWDFLVLGHHGSLRIDPSARVPPVTWTVPGGGFTDATAHTVRW